ncbi:efflux RND transporter periplasmic adaptor subunit [Albidovulum sp.]|jgi:RND family efflux transporter MFP subunit|uniref:efflux RND transporter periplasmic adaptor subunit n=2 Tax=Albidovulum sp. TaxID=1872424 RepID=UPI00304B4656
MIRPVLLSALLALPAAAADAPVPETVVPRPVVSIIVNPETGLPVTYVGTVAARTEADLGFPLSGTVAERPVSAGDTVAKGEVLARLNPEDLDSALRAAEAGVTVAAAQLRSATDARDRAQVLARRGVGSATRLEDADRALVAAEARLEQAEAAVARARDLRGLATLTAPQDGVVTAVMAEPGAAVAAGQPVLRLAATGDREIVIDLTELDVAAYPVGTRFAAHLVVNPEVSAPAILNRIDPVAYSATRTRAAHLTLQSPPAAFRLGALVRVTPAAREDAGVALPLAAVLDAATAAAVWVVDRADNSVHRRPVTLGPEVGGFVVIASGLAAGDEVVTKGIHSLEDGQVVGPRVSE